MRIRRRSVLLGLGAVAVVPPGGYVLSSHGLVATEARGIIAAAFGPDYADHPETARFLADYLDRSRRHRTWMQWGKLHAKMWLRPGASRAERAEALVESFARSTSVVAHARFGDEYGYIALFDPGAMPCANALGALYRPDGVT